MDLGSLFSGFGSQSPPPPNDPPATNYTTIIIIAIALAVILFYGNTPFSAGSQGVSGPMCPPYGQDKRHNSYYDRYGENPYPNRGIFGFQGNQWFIIAAIVIFAFLLFPRGSAAPPA